MRRRSGQPRKHKQLSPTATNMLRQALSLPGGALSRMGPDLPPNLLPTMTAGLGAGTWNRYTGVLGPWQKFAAEHHTPFLPADPAMFLRFLSKASDKETGQSQTKHRACAMDAISRLAGFPSPTSDRAVRLFRAGIARTKTAKRGPVMPVFPSEIPLPPTAAGSTSIAARGRFLPCRSDPVLRQNAAICHMWMMSAAGARFDDFQEGQIGDGLPFPDAFDLTFFGTKTDPTLEGQPSVAPALTAPGSGTGVWADGLRAALDRLLSLSEDDARFVGERFRRTIQEHNPRHLDGGASAMRAWPDDIRQRTDRLYLLGIPAHCLPFYGRWLTVHPSRHMDLSEPIHLHEFVRAARLALQQAGFDPKRVGAHSFRRGRGVHLTLSGSDLRNVTTLFRHRSPASTQPYLLPSARLADTAAALHIADARRGVPSGRQIGVQASPPGIRPGQQLRPPGNAPRGAQSPQRPLGYGRRGSIAGTWGPAGPHHAGGGHVHRGGNPRGTAVARTLPNSGRSRHQGEHGAPIQAGSYAHSLLASLRAPGPPRAGPPTASQRAGHAIGDTPSLGRRSPGPPAASSP